MKNAIIIGASSGIGRELAKILSKDNYFVGIAARRVELLKNLQTELPNKSYVKYLDISNHNEIEKTLSELVNEMLDVDLIIISSGTGYINHELDWDKEQETIDVNVIGFTRVLNFSVKYFQKRGSGHIVGISSLAALRGDRSGPAYSASKAFESNYMEAIRSKMKRENKKIFITDIQPGLVDTAMAKGDGLFWVSKVDVAARQIYNAILKKKSKACVTKRWKIIEFLLKHMPDWLYTKF